MEKNKNVVLYRQVLEGYKHRLSENPDCSMKQYCNEAGIDYDRFSSWRCCNGIFVEKIRKEVLGDVTRLPEPESAFVRLLPDGFGPSDGGGQRLRGVSVTFPDGTRLSLQSCGVGEMISLMERYDMRRGGRGGAGCSD